MSYREDRLNRLSKALKRRQDTFVENRHGRMEETREMEMIRHRNRRAAKTLDKVVAELLEAV